MKYKWIPGYLIFLSLVFTLKALIMLEVDGFTVFLLSTMAYLSVGFFVFKRAWCKKLLLGMVFLWIGVIVLDLGLTVIHRVNTGDTLIGLEDFSFRYSEAKENRHTVALVLKIRDAIRIEPFVRWGLNGMPSNRAYLNVLIFLAALALSTLFAWMYHAKWLKFLMVLPLFVYLFGWFFYWEFSNTVYMLYFVGFFAYLMVERNFKWVALQGDYEKTYYKPQQFMRYAFLLAILFFICGFVAYKLIPVKLLNAQVSGLVPNLWGIRSEFPQDDLGVFSLIQTPLSDGEGKLGGDIKDIDDETPLFWLTLDQNPKEPVYLKSVVKDFYTGKRWVNQTNAYKNQFIAYRSEKQNQALLKDPEKLDTFISGSVIMDEMKTLSVFVPLGFYESSLNENSVFVSDENEAFYKSGWFKKPVDQYHFKATGQDYNLSPSHDYNQLSDSIHKGVYSIARYLNGYAKRDYDKMNVLIEFLTTRYKYNLKVGSTQELDDFVSNFILHMREGYCTYFASSLALLGRINGVPTRYVEGFVISPSQIVKGTAYKVTEANAHAWVEAYIEGQGWVIFEATPPYVTSPSDSEAETSFPRIESEDSESAESVTSRLQANQDLITSGEEDGSFNLNPVIRDRRQKELEKVPFYVAYKGLILMTLVLVVLIIMALTVGPSHLYLNPRSKRQKALRRLYFLTYLAMENARHPVYDVQMCLRMSNVPPHQILKFETFLYGSAYDLQTEAMILEINGFLKREAKVYRARFGNLRYMRLRWRRIRKAIASQ